MWINLYFSNFYFIGSSVIYLSLSEITIWTHQRQFGLSRILRALQCNIAPLCVSTNVLASDPPGRLHHISLKLRVLSRTKKAVSQTVTAFQDRYDYRHTSFTFLRKATSCAGQLACTVNLSVRDDPCGLETLRPFSGHLAPVVGAIQKKIIN